MKISQNRINEIALFIANQDFGQEGKKTILDLSERLVRLVIDRIDDNDLFEHDQEQKKYILELQNQVLDYQKKQENLQALSESLILKLQEKLKLCDAEPDPGLHQRGLYDGYLNSLNIVIETCAKAIKQA
jgi:superfamily I DNA and RNA helicase